MPRLIIVDDTYLPTIVPVLTQRLPDWEIASYDSAWKLTCSDNLEEILALTDVILSDVQMPRMSGPEFWQFINATIHLEINTSQLQQKGKKFIMMSSNFRYRPRNMEYPAQEFVDTLGIPH